MGGIHHGSVSPCGARDVRGGFQCPTLVYTIQRPLSHRRRRGPGSRCIRTTPNVLWRARSGSNCVSSRRAAWAAYTADGASPSRPRRAGGRRRRPLDRARRGAEVGVPAGALAQHMCGTLKGFLTIDLGKHFNLNAR